MDRNSRFEGKVAFVTGAGNGIGRATAVAFAQEGASVVVADRSVEHSGETVDSIEQFGGQVIAVGCDVTDGDQVRAALQRTVETFGRLDFAFNNAGIALSTGAAADITEDEWDRTINTNLRGVFLCMKHEIRAMQARGQGAVVNIGSGNEHTAKAGLSWYLAAKQGIYAMTKCAALDYGEAGIRVNAVAPGPMWTPLLRETVARNPGHEEAHVAHVPLRRICEPEEVAEAAVWLCSPAASFVTGVTLSADGGYVLGSA